MGRPDTRPTSRTPCGAFHRASVYSARPCHAHSVLVSAVYSLLCTLAIDHHAIAPTVLRAVQCVAGTRHQLLHRITMVGKTCSTGRQGSHMIKLTQAVIRLHSEHNLADDLLKVHTTAAPLATESSRNCGCLASRRWRDGANGRYNFSSTTKNADPSPPSQ